MIPINATIRAIEFGTGIGGTYVGGAMLANAASEAGGWTNTLMQGGAIGVLAFGVYYTFAKIIPAAMKQRQEEGAAFVSAMRDLTMQHASDVRQLHAEHREERRAYEEVNAAQVSKLTEALNKLTVALGNCPMKEKQ